MCDPCAEPHCGPDCHANATAAAHAFADRISESESDCCGDANCCPYCDEQPCPRPNAQPHDDSAAFGDALARAIASDDPAAVTDY